MRNENVNKPINQQSCQTDVISSFFRKIFRFYLSKFEKPKWGSLKGCTKYYLSITFFNKWNFNFRIMNQDNSFFFRNEELHYFIYKIKNKKNITF